ncbi:MAG TPA: hypothetical protein VJJ52_06425 [Candidatus Nanoarchaeia archaeon]|nr:hypothetical protein [Candidatus Nanoarchaeia archaeon]
MDMSRKSQAALEFLTTYGWAFLVILIMIGTLAYFGILNPSKVLPSRCNFGAEFQCQDYQISASANTFKLRLKNGVGEPVSISAVTLGSEGSTAYSCTLTSPTLPYSLVAGNTTDFSWGTCNSATAGFVGGDKGKVLITVTYNSLVSGGTYSRQVKGEVYTTVV